MGSIPTVSTLLAPDAPSDVVRRYFATFGAGGLDEAAALWHPDVEWHSLRGAEVITGPAAMHRYYAEWVETLEDLHTEEFEVVFEESERVVARVNAAGRGRVSGVPAANSFYVSCVIRDGLIVSGHEYATREEALGA